MKEQRFITIFDSIRECGFSVHTLELIDNYTNDILNGRTNLDRFNQQEHAGLCLADSPLIGAYAVCGYARASLESGSYASASQGSPTNWEIDGKQEECVEQWARARTQTRYAEDAMDRARTQQRYAADAWDRYRTQLRYAQEADEKAAEYLRRATKS